METAKEEFATGLQTLELKSDALKNYTTLEFNKVEVKLEEEKEVLK